MAGLAALLDGLGLSDQLPAAAAWCEANGADSVAAIVEVEMVAEFVEALALAGEGEAGGEEDRGGDGR